MRYIIIIFRIQQFLSPGMTKKAVVLNDFINAGSELAKAMRAHLN